MSKLMVWPRGVYYTTVNSEYDGGEIQHNIKILDGKDVYDIHIDWYRSRVMVNKVDNSDYDRERYKKTEARMLSVDEDVNWGFSRNTYSDGEIKFTEPTDKYITRMSAAIKLLFDYDMVEPRLLFDNSMRGECPFYLVDKTNRAYHLKKGNPCQITLVDDEYDKRPASRPVWPFDTVYMDDTGDGMVPYSRLKEDIFDAMKDIDDPFAFKDGRASFKMQIIITPITRVTKKKRGKK